MNREQEIDKFLKQIRDAYSFNPRLVSQSYVYSLLNEYNVNFDKGRTNYGQYFDSWEERYENNSNLFVYEHPKQPGFLQFQNHQQLYPNDSDKTNYLKLYLSVEPEYISPVVNAIFDFIADNKIMTHSKVCEYDRSDSVVLRIKHAKDAEKVINFINNNKLISEHTRTTNPFLIRSGAVGAAFDERLSYNFAVSYLVNNYINERFQLNASSDISVEDFRRYVKSYFKHTFETCENLEAFRNTEYFKNNLERVRGQFPHEKDIEEALLVNFMHVTNAIGVATNNNADFKTLEEAYEYSKDPKFNDKYKQKFKDAISSKYNSSNLLDEYIRYAFKKYGNNNDLVFNYLNAYIHGNPSAITRDNNFRFLFVDNLEPAQILRITGNNPKEYIEKVTSSMKYLGYNTYVEACKATCLKYGKKQLMYAIKNSLNGDYKKFTNGDNNLREKLKKYVAPTEVEEYLKAILEANGLEYDEEAILNIVDIIEDTLQKEPIEKNKTK